MATRAHTHAHTNTKGWTNPCTPDHTPGSGWKHQQHPSKLSRPPRLASACVDCWEGTFSGFLLPRHGCSAHTPPSHRCRQMDVGAPGGEQIKPFSSQKYILKGPTGAASGGRLCSFVIKGWPKNPDKKKEKKKDKSGERNQKPY